MGGTASSAAPARPLAEVAGEGQRIDKAYLLSCVNSRLEDLDAAAAVVRGRHVAEGVELYVAAASAEVQAEAEARGVWQVLEAAGARLEAIAGRLEELARTNESIDDMAAVLAGEGFTHVLTNRWEARRIAGMRRRPRSPVP